MEKQYKITDKKRKVLDKYAQDEHGVNYKELFGKKDRSKQQAIYQKAANNNFEYITETRRSPLPPKDKLKLIDGAKKLGIELDFDINPRIGVVKTLPNGKINP